MSAFEPTEFPRLDPIDARCAEVADHAALARTPLYEATRALLADLAELAAVDSVDDVAYLWGGAA